MFGQTRISASMQGAQIAPTGFVEWFVTVTMSPQIAEQLHDALHKMLGDYTKQFGAIPKQSAAPQQK